MFNRELIEATVITYGGVDEYGQMNTAAQAERSINLTFGLYQHQESNDIRYQDITHYALTKDKDITDKDSIKINNVEYKVQFVNPCGRLTQIFLK